MKWVRRRVRRLRLRRAGWHREPIEANESRSARRRLWRRFRRLGDGGLHRVTGVRRRTRDLWFGLPALAALLSVVVATAAGHVRQANGGPKYRAAGERKLAQGDFATAKLYLQRAVTSAAVNRQDIQFSLARAHLAGGETDRAETLIRMLAHPFEVGHPPAHRMLAVAMSRQLTATRQLPDLEDWHWHLEHADRANSPEMQVAWAKYHLATGDVRRAIEAYQRAAEENPALWIQVVELQARLDDNQAARRTLARARSELEGRFRQAPENPSNRLLYATALFYLGELRDVEQLMKEGLQSQDDPAMRRLLAAVFVRLFDAEAEGPRGVEHSLRYLLIALRYDPNFQPALMRLVRVSQESAETRKETIELMRQMIASGEATPIAHFVLGSLEWIAGRKELAQLNFQQAMALDDKLPVVANNVAYLLAMEDGADLDRALELANQAVAADPTNESYLDTRATVHLKRQDYAAAAVDYQRALETAADPAKIQRQLATVYEQLGDAETAAEFRRAAAEEK